MVVLSERKDSIRRKYSLQDFKGKLANELDLHDGTNMVRLLSHEELDRLKCGNLSSYTKNIEDEGVREMLRNLKSDYIPIGSVNYGN